MSTQETTYNIEKALSEAGVTGDTLTVDEKKSLDEQGFVMFRNLIDAEWLKQMQDKFEELFEKEGEKAGTEVHQEKGTRRLSDLMNKGEVFDKVYMHPKLLAGMYHIIGREFKLSAMNGRDVLKGQGLQPLHEDWNDFKDDDGGMREPNDPYHVANSLVLLDDFTEDNGPTRVVPGTHKMKAPQFYLENREAPHPDEIKVLGKAGDAILFNSHLWHGGTTSQSNKKRRVLHPYYVAREFQQQQNQRQYIREETYKRISPAARYILDVENSY